MLPHIRASAFGPRDPRKPASTAITFGSEGLSRLTSSGGNHAGFRYLPLILAVPVHCLPAGGCTNHALQVFRSGQRSNFGKALNLLCSEIAALVAE